jgi:hypothetical protein
MNHITGVAYSGRAHDEMRLCPARHNRRLIVECLFWRNALHRTGENPGVHRNLAQHLAIGLHRLRWIGHNTHFTRLPVLHRFASGAGPDRASALPVIFDIVHNTLDYLAHVADLLLFGELPVDLLAQQRDVVIAQ